MSSYIRTEEIRRKNSLSNIGKNLGKPRPKGAYSFPKGNQAWKNRDQQAANKVVASAMQRPEIKKKISESIKKLWKDPDYRYNMVNKQLGKPSHRKGVSMKQEYGTEKADVLKKNISLCHKGRKYSDEVNKRKGRFGKENAMSRPEVKTKQKLACRTYGAQWKGGISYQPYTKDFDKDFKKRIRTRDCHSCTKCHTEDKLCVHHINYDKTISTDKNCCILCFTCNSEVNWGRKKWTNYFQTILNETFGYHYG